MQEGVAVIDAASLDIIYCNAALNNDHPDEENAQQKEKSRSIFERIYDKRAKQFTPI